MDQGTVGGLTEVVGREGSRLSALHRYDILDTPPEPQFDRIVSMASRMTGAPISLLSLIAEDRQWFKAQEGLGSTQTPRSLAFCDHAIRHRGVMVVKDALTDARFADHPMVTGTPNIRFYAGAPLITRDGHVLGTLCIIDRQPRALSVREEGFLLDLAAIAMDELELRLANRELAALARTDPLTGCFNRRTFLTLAEREIGRLQRAGNDLAVMLLDIDHFKRVNDHNGHEAGDHVLSAFARRISDTVRVQDIFARLGGEEFGLIMPDTNLTAAQQTAERLREAVMATPVETGSLSIPVTVSIGVAQVKKGERSIDIAMRRADCALYLAKLEGRNLVRTHI
ncbi:GGDEF domain-containing protein [Niveispirillum fermenti]|uniref:GGDEF domain-containing protein n=1 Tax=Niveispirillum fermenti TaxID=1233113 RepID=UPI003A88A160